MKTPNLLLLLTMAFLMWQPAAAQDAREIIKKADDKMQGNSNRSEMKMTIIRPTWQREVQMKAWSLGRDYSLILITAPARDKGTAFLKRKNELWNWQPSIDRVIKLPPSMMLQSWMGSDFTNDDLVKESSIVEDYEHHLAEDTVINGHTCYKIVLTPRPEAAVVWGKIVTYIEKDTYIQLLAYYYDEDDFLVNTLVLSNIKNLGGRMLPSRLEMIPADKPGHKTVVEYLNLEFDVGLNESFFSLQNLKRVR